MKMISLESNPPSLSTVRGPPPPPDLTEAPLTSHHTILSVPQAKHSNQPYNVSSKFTSK